MSYISCLMVCCLFISMFYCILSFVDLYYVGMLFCISRLLVCWLVYWYVVLNILLVCLLIVYWYVVLYVGMLFVADILFVLVCCFVYWYVVLYIGMLFCILICCFVYWYVVLYIGMLFCILVCFLYISMLSCMLNVCLIHWRNGMSYIMLTAYRQCVYDVVCLDFKICVFVICCQFLFVLGIFLATTLFISWFKSYKVIWHDSYPFVYERAPVFHSIAESVTFGPTW